MTTPSSGPGKFSAIVKLTQEKNDGINKLIDIFQSKAEEAKSKKEATTSSETADADAERERIVKELEAKRLEQERQAQELKEAKEKQEMLEKLAAAANVLGSDASEKNPSQEVGEEEKEITLQDIRLARKAYLEAERAANKSGILRFAKGLVGVQLSKLFTDESAAQLAYEAKLGAYNRLKSEQVDRIAGYATTYARQLEEKKDELSGLQSGSLPESDDAVRELRIAKLQKEIQTITNRAEKLIPMIEKNKTLIILGGESDRMHEALDATLDNKVRDGWRSFTKWFNQGKVTKALKSTAAFGVGGYFARTLGGFASGNVAMGTALAASLTQERTKFNTRATLEKKAATQEVGVKGSVLEKLSSWYKEKSTKEKAILASKVFAGSAVAAAAALALPAIAASAVAGMAGGFAAKKLIGLGWKVGDQTGAGGTYETRMAELSAKVERGEISFAEAQRTANVYKFTEEVMKGITMFASRVSGFGAGLGARAELADTDIMHQQNENIGRVLKIFNPSTGKVEEVPVGQNNDSAAQQQVTDSTFWQKAFTLPGDSTTGGVHPDGVTSDTTSSSGTYVWPGKTNALSSAFDQMNQQNQLITDTVDQHTVGDSLNTVPPMHADSVVVQSHDSIPAGTQPTDTGAVIEEKIPSGSGVHPKIEVTAPEVEHPKVEALTPETTTNPDIPVEAKIHHNDGITYAFMRQIEHDPKLQEALGYKPGDDLHSFARHEAVDLAKKFGYITPEGEVRTYDVGAAYVLKVDDHGDLSSVEYDAKGHVIETLDGTHTEGGPAGIEKHEYFHTYGDHHTSTAPAQHIDQGPAIEQHTPGGVPGNIDQGEIIHQQSGGDAGNLNSLSDHHGGHGGVNGAETVGDNAQGGNSGQGGSTLDHGAASPKPADFEYIKQHLDFPKTMRVEQMLTVLTDPNSAAVQSVNKTLMDQINHDNFAYLDWFHGKPELADAFKLGMYRDHLNPIQAYINAINGDPTMSPMQKTLSLELMARHVENKVTPQFLEHFRQSFTFYGPTSENNTIQALAGHLKITLRTDLGSYEDYIDAQNKAIQEKAAAAAASAQKQSASIPGSQNAGNSGKQSEIVSPASSGASSPAQPTAPARVAYGTGGKTDDLYWDPKGGAAQGAKPLTPEQVSNFGKVSIDDASPEEIEKFRKMGVLPKVDQGPAITQQTPGGVSAIDQGPAIVEQVPGGVTNIDQGSPITEQVPGGVANLDQESAAASTIPDNAFIAPDNLTLGAQQVIGQLESDNVFNETTLAHKDILAEKLFTPILAMGRSAENVASFYHVVAGDPQTYVPLRDFMTHNFSVDMPMADKLQMQIHEMEKEAFGAPLIAYPEKFSVHQWIEQLVRKIAEKRSS